MTRQEYNRAYYLENRGRLIEKAKRYQKENRLKTNATNRAWKVKNAETVRIYNRQYEKNNEDARRKFLLDYKKKYPERMYAKGVVAYWIKIGKLQRPINCSACNKSDCRIVAHHEDYSRPSDVEWLCDSCHKLIHSGVIVLIKC